MPNQREEERVEEQKKALGNFDPDNSGSMFYVLPLEKITLCSSCEKQIVKGKEVLHILDIHRITKQFCSDECFMRG